MVRTQVQLTEQQQIALRRLSAATGRSMADLVREGIERMLSSRPLPDRSARIERVVRLAGQFSSGAADGSVEHDRHLAEAFK